MREDGTTLSDDSHELYVYKVRPDFLLCSVLQSRILPNPSLLCQCDENSTFSNQALYLGLPCCKEDFGSCPSIPSSLIFQRSTKETFWISTQLSSTKLTQNGTSPPLPVDSRVQNLRLLKIWVRGTQSSVSDPVGICSQTRFMRKGETTGNHGTESFHRVHLKINVLSSILVLPEPSCVFDINPCPCFLWLTVLLFSSRPPGPA